MNETIDSAAWEKMDAYVYGTLVLACFTDPKRYVITSAFNHAGNRPALMHCHFPISIVP
jgi:hypothetical protein